MGSELQTVGQAQGHGCGKAPGEEAGGNRGRGRISFLSAIGMPSFKNNCFGEDSFFLVVNAIFFFFSSKGKREHVQIHIRATYRICLS